MKKFVLNIPFDQRMWASRQGVRWREGAWIYEGEILPETLHPYQALPFSLDWHRERQLNPSELFQVRLLPSWDLRPHQEVAKQKIISAFKSKKIGFALADQVGLGKTLSAWAPVLELPEVKKILVVTTLAAVAHWRNTILRTKWAGQEVTLVNYDRLGKLLEEPEAGTMSTRAKGKRKRLAKLGVAPEFDYVIWDESQKGKNLTSARSIMMQKIAQKARFNVWASGTLGQNPLELAYLAALLAQVTGHRLKDLSDFEQWCVDQNLGVEKGQFGKWTWNRSPQSIEKIKRWLFDEKAWAGIRRLPEDIANWPSLERQMFKVPLSGPEQDQYNMAFQAFRLARQGGALKKGGHKKESALVERLRFRQKSSWVRLNSTFDLMEDLLENGHRVAISVAFHDTLEALKKMCEKKGWKVASIHGKMSGSEKEQERLRFQKEEAEVCLFTVEEAISLHQGEHGNSPRALIIHDLRWSALSMSQIEGRCHRDGRFAPCYWMFAEHEKDEAVAQVIFSRVIGMKSMHGDETEDLLAIEKVLFGE